MLSDKPSVQNRRSKGRRAVKAETNLHWSDSQKLEAVQTYLALGNLALTASVLKIPEVTMRKWKQQMWWSEIEGELKVQDELQISTRLRKIIETTLEATEDRIKNGDWIYNNKEGCLMRKPVNLRDVHKVGMDLMDRREHLDNKTPASINIEQIDDRLAKLAAQFEAIASGRRSLEVTDVIVGQEVLDAHTDNPTP